MVFWKYTPPVHAPGVKWFCFCFVYIWYIAIYSAISLHVLYMYIQNNVRGMVSPYCCLYNIILLWHFEGRGISISPKVTFWLKHYIPGYTNLWSNDTSLLVLASTTLYLTWQKWLTPRDTITSVLFTGGGGTMGSPLDWLPPPPPWKHALYYNNNIVNNRQGESVQ